MKKRIFESVFDQAANALYNFLIGFCLLKFSSRDIFGIYIYITSIYFIMFNPFLGGLFGVFSADIRKINLSKFVYVNTIIFLFLLIAFFGSIFMMLAIFNSNLKYNFETFFFSMSMTVGVFLYEVLRRLSIVNGESGRLINFNLFRLGCVVIFLACINFFDKTFDFEIIFFSAVNFFGVVVFFIYLYDRGVKNYKINKNYLIRCIKYGVWGGLSIFSLSFYDQGIYLYIEKFSGLHDVAIVKSMVYLYAVVGPIMQIFDLKSPQIIEKIYGKKINKKNFIHFSFFGLAIGFLFGAIIYIIKINIWMQYVDSSLREYKNLIFYVGLFCSMMVARSFVSPFLRISGAKGMFFCNVFSAIFTYFYINLFNNSVDTYIKSFFIWSLMMFSSVFFYGLYVYSCADND